MSFWLPRNVKENIFVNFFLLKNRLKFHACYFCLPHLRGLREWQQKETKEKTTTKINSWAIQLGCSGSLFGLV